MPHLVLLYSPDIEADADMPGLCRALADCMLAQRDEHDRQVFPTGGTRVLAYPAAHAAIADGRGDYGFVYANLRMGSGRSATVHRQVGDALLAVLRQRLDALLERRPVGVTLQIDESQAQVYDAKHSSLHPLFTRQP
ncbi:5-carboxymethyl-2-hydroxymuconate Delta-isomerase [Pseudomonas mosselii]|uniref:5-carboxymethyl-2-hydroxymuconate isomerase n=1 Tax=Pseudomonas mosselii TaxID=78327 RepID=A0A7W2JYD2_9PSED|nr:5-carboxymethyl-2-hydroxymuconate isomerase [Pseudomonas mosselii]MBA6067392.1 5-carboxymethyl-2-hydroxymuconate isomerase [Pseudomonas mosselii]MBH3310097.1 5-carboxymethyl-2-hydroxymuconate isomerase [Pseudomonas mosselii]MBH3326763.1 5-carboxymethyl-2-hydroxymuconate isomerase [Pseudomonas mosselii]MDH0627667.1 5-carboxymethyl-2-hydroxymuconate Delta-isomerase [Pseudomonas mosselii]MDH0677640.1 5-carboxymethyl-2-hydroxymuconate Delta-isomerase [Pseudomonas mosselii]